ncbi:Protein of unknown function DUF262 [Actinoplanes philippinensis]|uniref:DUF262 domain-containing protein n=1 Tax=Actinoplanes philippinensis TaxID=35752 RepID=A0A1I2HF22_9ACTN|nr:DUF262 domain-containing protein [Actinoplanes philippinensis]SFF28138.1 Protein of unknown function DUF262 [Actinoplanes philippinensis]
MVGSSGPKEIVCARSATVRVLFEGNAYGLGYFQRRYAWEKLQVEKLMLDLVRKFEREWQQNHQVADALNYEPYFLGSVITYRRADGKYLADGQQRVVTLLLLLIRLYHLTSSREDTRDQSAHLRTLILGGDPVRRQFTITDIKYRSCFNDLLNGHEFSAYGAPDIVRVWRAYQDVTQFCLQNLPGEALPNFVTWLLERVSLVVLDAGDPDRALEMFVAMNDRGVRLTPLDLLKHYLLSDARPDPGVHDAGWQSMQATLDAVAKDATLDFVRGVLRAHYFHLHPDDGDGITLDEAPHEWLVRHEDAIWPRYKKGDHAALFTEELQPLYPFYADLLRWAAAPVDGHLGTWFNNSNGIIRQFDLTMAAIRPGDDEGVMHRKATLVANLLDLFVVTRGLVAENYGQSEIDELVSELRPAVRESRTVHDLAVVLGKAAADWYPRFGGVLTLRYRERGNRPFVVYFLARLTAWLESGTGRGDRAVHMLSHVDGRGHEVEHLFTSRHADYRDVLADGGAYSRERSRLGALVLLEGSDNASLGALRLVDKLGAYRSHYLLAGSLHPGSYGRGEVRFRRFREDEKLDFGAYDETVPIPEFVESRGRLFKAMAEKIWSADKLGLILPAEPAAAPKGKQRKRSLVTLAELIREGMLAPSTGLVGTRNRKVFRATLLGDGRIRTANGEPFPSPTAAAEAVLDGKSANGWTFWRIGEGKETLAEVRTRYERRH